MSGPITDAANAISDKSPQIKAFAKLVAAKLEPVAPPPPTTAWAHGGHGYWKPGGTLPGDAKVMDVVTCSDGNQEQLSALPASVLKLVYMSPLSCDTRPGYFFGMSGQDLVANGWHLKDASGKPIPSQSYPNSWLADIGLPAYQTAWSQAVAAYLTTNKRDGCQFDDVVAQLSGYAQVPVPKYPTAAAWETAMVAGVNAIGGYLRSKGFYTFGNTYASGGRTPDFALKLKAGCNGVMFENFGTASDFKAVLDGGLDLHYLAYAPLAGEEAVMRSVDNGRAVFTTAP